MFKKFFSNNIFEIYCLEKYFGVIPEPVPSSKMIPKWFKNVKPFVDTPGTGRFGENAMTIKKCMPVLDAMSEGFIIPLQGDVTVRSSKNKKYVEVSNAPDPEFKLIEFHSLDQVGGSTWPGGETWPLKFINYWIIKTKPGWSTLFIAPLNHFDSRFTCLSGIVDTDRYRRQVNFPAIWNVPDFNGLLKSGTPLVQCIPIKRGMGDKFKIRKATNKEFEEWSNTKDIQNTRLQYYSKELRDGNR
ncbi:hypothetical protein EB118_15950 [bacterium]|nr:hypothetical protein [bacterium]